ncbi:MAG: class I SAM-dependent methyltransferase [Solirubrobacteraceae bacterium]
MHQPDTSRRRTLREILGRREERADEPPAPPPQPVDRDRASFERTLAEGHFAVEDDRASRALVAALDEGAIAAIEARIDADPGLAGSYRSVEDPSVARHLLLAYGTWLQAPEILERTALIADQPPEAVHAMARGPLSAGGGFYEADMIGNALASAGASIESIDAALDFGCSSGRVLRVLGAAFPQVRWIGCDPNAGAIEWAQRAFPGHEWFANANEPPLPLADGELDLVYAISIWSHFEPLFGLRWFEEMRRVLRPGGHLIVTTHGWTALAYDALRDRRPLHECAEIERSLYRQGHWFIDPFGDEGDWGVVNPRWGSAFVTPEFLLGQLCPQWRVVEFVPGRNQQNQDVYVLARA